MKASASGIPAAHNASSVSMARLSKRRSAVAKNGFKNETLTSQNARKRTQRYFIYQYERVIVLLLEDMELAEFGVGNIDSAVLCPRNAIASRQAIHRNLATLVDVTVPYGSPG
jgi:hypothetical protein